MRFTPRVVAAIAAAALLLAGCSGGREAQQPVGSDNAGVQLDKDGYAFVTGEGKRGGTIRVLGQPEFSHLDPSMGNDGGVNNFYRLIYRTLTTAANEPGPGGTKIVPDLATDTGRPNEDATEWTFTLKDNIFFEDGSPITAADFKYGLERSMDPALRIGSDFHVEYLEGAKEYQGIYKDPKGLDSIEVVDDKTITFHLNRPVAYFPVVVTSPPFTPFPAGKIANVRQLDEKPIASGPYKLQSYQRGAKLTLIRNDKWDPATDEVRPALPDSYEFQFGIDAATVDDRMLAAQGDDANAVGVYSIQPSTLAKIQTPEIKARTIRDHPSCTFYLYLNMAKKPLDDLKVRQAINYAIDKQSVITVTGGPQVTQVATDMLLPNVPGREEFDLYPTPDHKGDVEKAKQLLAEAGHPDGFKVTMDVRGLPKWQAQSEAIQASLAKVGIEAKLNVIDATTYYEVIQTTAKQNEIGITGWCGGGQTGETLLTPLFDGDRLYPTGNNNNSQLNDPEINKAFDEIARMSNVDEQNAAVAKLNRQIMELAPVVPLVRDTPLQLIGPNVGGAFAHAGMSGYVDLTSLGLKNPGS